MIDLDKSGKYFWLLNLIVIIVICGVLAETIIFESSPSKYRLQLNEMTHYLMPGFALDGDLSDALVVPAGSNVGAGLLEGDGYVFMRPGKLPYREFTITTLFDYTEQYDALQLSPNTIPGITLPGLGDSYEIYLNGHLVASEWHVEKGKITVHKLARGAVYPINPTFFSRGENALAFRIYGAPTTIDTGLAVTHKYAIDDFNALPKFNNSQIFFAGGCLAMALTFLVFFLVYKGKKLNLWFSIAALSISMYTFFRAGVFQSIFPNYELALRLEIISLFTFAYFIAVLLYTCDKERFNIGMKVYTGIYAVLFAMVFLPGHQFVLDVVKVFFVLFVPLILYIFMFSLCVPLVREAKGAKPDSIILYFLNTLSGTLRGNMIVAAFLPIALALFDQMSYVVFSYQEFVWSQYGFLLFFANTGFALAAYNQEINSKLEDQISELQQLVSAREYELEQKSDEIAEAKTTQMRFRDVVTKEIRAPLGEVVGAIELQMLRAGLTSDMVSWLGQLLEAERNIRRNLDSFFGGTEHLERGDSRYYFGSDDTHYNKATIQPNPGGTRHLFVINPKSFVTLKDLKNFLLSIEMCFSAGHRAEYKIYISRYPRDAYSAVHRYLSATPADEIARVYAVGGDGILFDCLNGLAKFPNAELAPIPYGNANDFVRSFGSDNIELFRDIKLMSKAPSRLVDAILCGQQYALCSCSIGIEAKAVQVFSNIIELINTGKARVFVPLIYKLGAIKALLDGSQNNMKYRLTIDGTDFSGDYLFINIGNIALNGGSNIPSPLAVPNDGTLNAIICKSSSVINSMRMLPAYTTGQFSKFPDYLEHCGLTEMHCESRSTMSVILDGETFYTHELDMKILPKAVKIVSPSGIGFVDYSQSAKRGAR